MAQALDKLAQELRSAVLGGDHALAGELASEYSAALGGLWESLPERDRAVSLIPRQASELLTWAHRMTLVQRAIAAAQLAVIEKASHYNVDSSADASGRGVVCGLM